jgi:peptidoglycan-associated lipoprotein
MNRQLSVLGAALLGLALVTGCSSPAKKDGDGAAVSGGGYGTDAAGSGASTSGLGGRGAWGGSALDDPNSPLSTRTIYFEYDSSEIRAEYLDVLRAHARYLAGNGEARMTLEGHADERGSREYNLALGERRASKVRQFILAEGVDGAQVNGVSYGEERPVDPGQGEAAWAHNRRVEIVY